MNLFQNPRAFLHPQIEPKIRNSSLHSGASSGTLQSEPWQATPLKGLPFSASTWTPVPNQIFKKNALTLERNAQKCRHMDFESPPKWRPNWHPQKSIKKHFWQFGRPKRTPKMEDSRAIFYAPTWPQLGAPILGPKSIFYDLGGCLLEPNLGRVSESIWPLS